MLDPDDIVLTANPTYLGAIQSFKSYRARIVGLDLTSSFQAAAEREQQIESLIREGKKIKFFYIIPDFQNPSGETLSLAERSELVAWGKIGVAAAEQIYVGQGRGDEKKQYVLEFLKSKGFDLNEESVNNAIEAAVKQLNTEGLLID